MYLVIQTKQSLYSLVYKNLNVLIYTRTLNYFIVKTLVFFVKSNLLRYINKLANKFL